MLYQLVEPRELSEVAVLLRQESQLLVVTWPQRPEPQWVGFEIPNHAKDITNYASLAIRVGHVHGAKVAVELPNGSLDLMFCVHDGSQIVDGAQPPVSLRPSGDNLVGLAALRTVEVELPFSSHDFEMENAKTIFLVFPTGTQGTGRLIISSGSKNRGIWTTVPLGMVISWIAAKPVGERGVT